jgi:hypothetical protein
MFYQNFWEEIKTYLINILNAFHEGSLPITYLGLPLHWKQPCLVKRQKMIDKNRKETCYVEKEYIVSRW